MAAVPKETTLAKVFWDSVERHADRPAQGWHDGQWRERTYGQFGDAVRAVADGLLALGVKPGDRVAVWSRNSPRWAEVDLACQTVGLVTVPIYDTLTGEKGAYILRDSGAKALFVEDERILARLDGVKRGRSLKHTILMDGVGSDGTLSYEDVLRKGEEAAGQADTLRAKVKPEDLSSLVYTSGTTGDPKGVMLTHWNFASNALIARQLVEFGPGDTFLSFLPLSHVFERTAGHFAAYAAGATVCYARSIDSLVEDMQHVKPTIMTSVPRLYEKIYARVQESVAKSWFLKRMIFNWAIETGRAANVYRQRGDPLPPALAKKVERADHLVFGKLKGRVGGRIRFFVSGGAALSKEIEEFFWAAGITILQGYGLTETSPVTNVNVPGATRFGSVGKTIPGTELKIDTKSWTSTREGVDEGEICFRGINVMKGYWKDDKATKDVFDKQGFFHTGDIGYLDEDGYLFITDRKKEIIVMSNGKNVAPQPIENALKLQPHIAQACIIGDGRKYIAALISPDFEALDKFAIGNAITPDDRRALVADQRVVSLIERQVEEVNKSLSRYEQVKKFWIVPEEWSVETGELTPTLKLKRRIILEQHKDEVEGNLYPA